jgi:hypothetical protein
MDLALRAGGAVSHDVGVSARLLLVIDQMGYPFAGVFTDALTLLATQHGSHFSLQAGCEGVRCMPLAPTRQVSRGDARTPAG